MVNVMRSFAESVSVSSSNYGCLKVENKRFVPNTQKKSIRELVTDCN